MYKKAPSNFYQDLMRGKVGEQKFFELYGDYLEFTDGRTGDFKILFTDIKIELKVDSYDPNKWPNLVLERWSSPGKPGGPHQALKHNCKYFAYYFVNHDLLFVFETHRLVKRIEMLEKRGKVKLEDRANMGYTTQYYRIPRKDLEDLMLHWHTEIERKYKLGRKNYEKGPKK